MTRLALSLLLFILVAGCWTGRPFYAVSESRGVIVEGVYELLVPDAEQDEGPVRVTLLPNGLTGIAPVSDPSDSMTVGLAPLPGADNVYVLWVVAMEGAQVPEDGTAYGLLAAEADGSYRTHFPTCGEGEELPPGAERRLGKFAECRFADRASLENALRRRLPRLPEGARLVPVRRQP